MQYQYHDAINDAIIIIIITRPKPKPTNQASLECLWHDLGAICADRSAVSQRFGRVAVNESTSLTV